MNDRWQSPSSAGLDAAAEAIRAGELVVFPTETVYGLGADATDEDAIGRVFEAKGRDRADPISLAVPDLERALDFVEPTDREQAFMLTFLPGPVTVVLTKRTPVPDVLTGGRERVGVRIPDHAVALRLLERVSPITATSANVSGRPAITRPEDIDPEIANVAGVLLDDGETPGTGSTVVDVAAGEIIRRGQRAAAVEAWLADRDEG
ncbi:MAG: L-threonylcarbamoyladenylate synthase [Halodesulfurarchaeum sp.]